MMCVKWMSVQTSHDAVGDQHHVDVDREGADDKERSRHDAAGNCHFAYSELVGQSTGQRSWQHKPQTVAYTIYWTPLVS